MEEREWWYRARFDAPSRAAGRTSACGSIFHGLDTYATVWLNGEELGRHANMFRPAVFDVTGAASRRREHAGDPLRSAARAHRRQDPEQRLGRATPSARRCARRSSATAGTGARGCRRSASGGRSSCARERSAALAASTSRTLDDRAARRALVAVRRRGRALRRRRPTLDRARRAARGDGSGDRATLACRRATRRYLPTSIDPPPVVDARPRRAGAVRPDASTLLATARTVDDARRSRSASARSTLDQSPDPDEPRHALLPLRAQRRADLRQGRRTGSRATRSSARSPAERYTRLIEARRATPT